MSVVFLLILAAIAAVLARLAVSARRVTAQDVAWIGGGPPTSEDEATVYRAYLARHRRHRLMGGLFGVFFAIVVGVRWSGSVTVGVGQGSPSADALFCGAAGVILGGLSAETFRLARPSSSTVSASLAARTSPSRPDLIVAGRWIVLGALVLGAVAGVSDGGLAPLGVGVLGALLTLIAHVTQRTISSRRRPVMSARAAAVDRRIRSFASESLAYLQLAGAVLVAAWTVSKLPTSQLPTVQGVQTLVVLGGLIATIVLLWRASPRPRSQKLALDA